MNEIAKNSKGKLKRIWRRWVKITCTVVIKRVESESRQEFCFVWPFHDESADCLPFLVRLVILWSSLIVVWMGDMRVRESMKVRQVSSLFDQEQEGWKQLEYKQTLISTGAHWFSSSFDQSLGSTVELYFEIFTFPKRFQIPCVTFWIHHEPRTLNF